MKIFIVALLCIASAFADVSEIVKQHHLEHESAILIEQPSAFPFGLPNEGVEIVEAIEILPPVVEVGDGDGGADIKSASVQLTQSHPDYQGPYHYDRPEITLEYGTPVVPAEKEEELLPEEIPILKDQPPQVPSTYLPPVHLQPVPLVGDNLVKRHIKYVVRRRV